MTNQDKPVEDSKHQLSMLYKKKTAEELLGLQRIYRWVIAAWIPLALAAIGFSSLWADIQGQSGAYSVTANWQACLTSADYQYIPIQEILQTQIANQTAAQKQKLKNCILGLYPDTCSIDCLLGISGQCVSGGTTTITITDPALPTGKFLSGLSYIGVQATIFSAAGHASMRRALVHPSWIPSTIALLIWFMYGIFTYYTVSPVLPVPGQTNSSLLMYLYYESSTTKFKNFNDGDNHCEKANVYVWAYLVLIMLIAFTMLIATIIGIYAEKIRYKQLKKHYEPLNHTEIPCVLAVIAVTFYFLLTVSKMTSSLNILNSIDNFNYSKVDAAAAGYKLWFPQIWFPFAQPFFDLSTILGIVSLMSIVRGYTIQSISAFRLSFIAALVFTITTYPGIVGAYQFYSYNDFSDDDSCKNFFLDPSTTAAFGYPNDTEAQIYCNSFRLALASATGFFVTLHFVTVACYYMITQNEHRNSFQHDEIDFDAIAKDIDLNRKSKEIAKGRGDTENPLQKQIE